MPKYPFAISMKKIQKNMYYKTEVCYNRERNGDIHAKS